MVVFNRNEVPPEAEEIQPGFFMHIREISKHWSSPGGWAFDVFAGGQKYLICTVNKPLEKTYRSKDDPPDAAMVMPKLSSRAMNEGLARVVGAVLVKAADHALVQNEAVSKELASQQAAYEEYQHELRLSRQRDEEQFKKLYELVIWQVGSKFRLRRRGMKATVFGTIDHVSEPLPDGSPPPNAYMLTTSEKNVTMRIKLRDVIVMDIKHDDSSRRYDNIYTEQLKEEV